MQHIFNSLKVVELASVLAGPSVGQFLAELGAEVIKVESPLTNGDVTRSWTLNGEVPRGGVSAYFSAVNAGKHSLQLNLKEKDDLLKLHQQLADADVLISSYKAGDAKKFGLAYEDLSTEYPQLIYAEITGYGDDHMKVGYDAVLQAETGFMYMNGEADGAPVKMPVALIDILAAHHLKEAVLLAYIHRLKTNEGSKVSVSLFDAAVSSLANQATNYLLASKNPQRMGSEHPNIAPYGKLYRCKDDQYILLAVGNDKQFAALCQQLNIGDVAYNELYSTNKQRVVNREGLNKLLADVIVTFSSEMLLSLLEKAKVPAGKLNSVKDLFQNPAVDSMVFKDGNNKPCGLRNFVGELSFLQGLPHLSPPPPFIE